VNDTSGHTVGDMVLREITQILINELGTDGVLNRLGGDEFGVYLPKCSQYDALKFAQNLIGVVSNYRFTYEHKVFNLGLSVGLREISNNQYTIENIISSADSACYLAKDAGRNKVEVYSSDNPQLQQRKSEVELSVLIVKALENDAFELHGQQISFADNKQTRMGYEVLVRMIDDDKSLIFPDLFIPSAERFKLMTKVDRWVVSNTLKFLSNNTNLLKDNEHFAINLNGQSLAAPGFYDFIIQCFETYKVPHKHICFEVTETVAVLNLNALVDLMKKTQSLGCKFSLDDFGSGFSSYGYLKHLPVDYLKIDGAFVRNIVEDKIDLVMVNSINEVAHALNMKTIAEFVENEHIIKKLKTIGVDCMQGYGIHKPQKLSELNGLLSS
jgi:diguanylate cyclase (GGDEF)-like protein